MTIVEYTEKVLNVKLQDYQKKYLEDIYEKYKQEGKLMFRYPRGGNAIGSNTLNTLACIYFCMLERGDLDDNIIKQEQT